MTTERQQLIHHIKRLEGQLASVRQELCQESPECSKAADTLLSAARSFASVRKRFTELFLQEHFFRPKTPREKLLFEKLTSLIKG